MTAIDAAPPALWAFLYPWCQVLRGKLHLEGRTAENSARWEYHWVAVRLPHAPEKANARALRRIREALDLLARVAVVDNAAWRALLVQQCRVPRDEDDQPLDCELRPRFRFVFNEKFVEPGALSPAAVCKEFFVTAGAQCESDDYLQARRELAEVEASLGLKTRRVVGVETWIPFELQFELLTLPNDTLETHLRDLNAMLGILQAQLRRDNVTGGLLPFEVESIRLDVGGVNISWSLTQRLTSLLSSGLPFSLFAFSLKKAAGDNYEEMQECVGRFLRTVVCGQERRGDHCYDAKQGGVDTLSVGCHDCDEWQFAALCSAISSASVTKHLRLYGVFRMSDTAEVRRWKWQWLTYALFRTSTNSSVQRALITAAQLTREDTLAIAVTVHSNSPPATVSTEVVPEESLLSLGDWRRDTSGSSSMLLEADSWLHIVNDDSDHFDVVLPGFGTARINQHCATQVEQLPATAPPCGLKALTLALGLHAGDDGGEVLADFLQLIGTPLQSLALYAVGHATGAGHRIAQQPHRPAPNGARSVRIGDVVQPRRGERPGPVGHAAEQPQPLVPQSRHESGAAESARGGLQTTPWRAVTGREGQVVHRPQTGLPQRRARATARDTNRAGRRRADPYFGPRRHVRHARRDDPLRRLTQNAIKLLPHIGGPRPDQAAMRRTIRRASSYRASVHCSAAGCTSDLGSSGPAPRRSPRASHSTLPDSGQLAAALRQPLPARTPEAPGWRGFAWCTGQVLVEVGGGVWTGPKT
ncbi:hypothetical protein ON010_g11342 [Phytophthora cinnamomi]|nr:hypothetical protein ON010_g11342 [Phytophthora cinnamomi]